MSDTQTNMARFRQRLQVSDLSEALWFPRYFQIETVRLCNSRCPFCAVDQWDKSHPFMTDALFDKIVDEMSGFSDWIEFVDVQRAGEPLLDRKIVPRIARFARIGIKRLSISTNASLLDDRTAHALLEAGLNEIMISIDSVDPDRYRQMRVGLDYDTVIANIENFFKVRQAVRPDMIVRVRGVSFYDMDDARQRDELARWEDFWGRFRQPQDRIYMKRAHNWGNQKQWEDHLPQYDPVDHPCVLPWSTMHVTAMGLVPLCPQDYDAKANLGDVNTDSIQSIWQGDKWRRVRDLHLSGRRDELGFCRGCRLFDLDFSIENWRTNPNDSSQTAG